MGIYDSIRYRGQRRLIEDIVFISGGVFGAVETG